MPPTGGLAFRSSAASPSASSASRSSGFWPLAAGIWSLLAEDRKGTRENEKTRKHENGFLASLHGSCPLPACPPPTFIWQWEGVAHPAYQVPRTYVLCTLYVVRCTLLLFHGGWWVAVAGLVPVQAPNQVACRMRFPYVLRAHRFRGSRHNRVRRVVASCHRRRGRRRCGGGGRRRRCRCDQSRAPLHRRPRDPCPTVLGPTSSGPALFPGLCSLATGSSVPTADGGWQLAPKPRSELWLLASGSGLLRSLIGATAPPRGHVPPPLPLPRSRGGSHCELRVCPGARHAANAHPDAAGAWRPWQSAACPRSEQLAARSAQMVAEKSVGRGNPTWT